MVKPREFFLIMFKDRKFELMWERPHKEKYEKGTKFYKVEDGYTIRELWEDLIKEF